METNEMTALKAKIDTLERINERLKDGMRSIIEEAHNLNSGDAKEILLQVANSMSMADYIELLKDCELVLYNFELEWMQNALIAKE